MKKGLLYGIVLPAAAVFFIVVGVHYDPNMKSPDGYGINEVSAKIVELSDVPMTDAQKVCKILIGNVERAYGWNVPHGSGAAITALDAAINTFQNVNGAKFCETTPWRILKGVKDDT